ncbi:hypothetical protein ES707_22201 [subsurface metagenome]
MSLAKIEAIPDLIGGSRRRIVPWIPSNGKNTHRITEICVSTDGFAVRTMRRQEVRVAVGWAEQEGWNPGIYDAEAFYAADPEGFFIAELDGEPVGSVSVVNYSEAFAFAGLYVVRPEYRDRGYGSRLFAAGVAHAGDRNIGGDGVVDMQEKYRTRSGFTLAYRNIRFEGTGGGSEPEGTVDLAGVPFDRLAAYDARHFPAPRPRFLEAGSGRKEPGAGPFSRTTARSRDTASSGGAITAIRSGRSLRIRRK